MNKEKLFDQGDLLKAINNKIEEKEIRQRFENMRKEEILKEKKEEEEFFQALIDRFSNEVNKK